MRPERLSIINIVVAVILWDILTDYFGASLGLFLFVLLLAIVIASFRFKFMIQQEHVIYQILLFHKPMIQKEIYPEQVSQMKFIRVGWAKKAAIIKTNKGMNIRLAVLEPAQAYDHLIEFAERNGIEIVKTRDYLILERMKSS